MIDVGETRPKRSVFTSVGIDLKELGVSCRNVGNFAQGLKFKADFHSKMSVCGHELPPPNNSNPGVHGIVKTVIDKVVIVSKISV